MLNFFYDSLDTLKKVKKPTGKEIREFLIQVIVTIVLWSLIFLFFDNIRWNAYKYLYEISGKWSVVAPWAALDAPLIDTAPSIEVKTEPVKDEGGDIPEVDQGTVPVAEPTVAPAVEPAPTPAQ